MIFRQLFDRESSTFTYLLADASTGEAALVDTVRENVDRDLKLVAELGLTLKHVLETHVHADHVTGAGEIRRRTGARTHVAREGEVPCADDDLVAGAVVRVGAVELVTLATPGHTAGCLSFLVRENGDADRVLTGDALLVRGCGRTDFQGGDSGTLFDSVRGQLFALPDRTLVFPAHDYKGFSVTTIGEERAHNPRLGEAVTRDAFVALMAGLNLPPPGKIHEALPLNRQCGDVAPAPRNPQGTA
ncbi:MAG: MBL fold metallo-hydrolase [Polyangiaceae bacterium]